MTVHTAPCFRDAIAGRPWRAMAIATAAGACVACVPHRALRRALTRVVGTITLVAVREYAVAYAAARASAWLDAKLSPAAPSA